MARQALGAKVEDRLIDTMDLSVEMVGEFDLVLYAGVIYHIVHPFYVLSRLAEIAREALIIETVVDLQEIDRPVAVFYPGESKPGMPQNGWGVNIRLMRDMLAYLGFGHVLVTPEQEPVVRAIFHAYRAPNPQVVAAIAAQSEPRCQVTPPAPGSSPRKLLRRMWNRVRGGP